MAQKNSNNVTSGQESSFHLLVVGRLSVVVAIAGLVLVIYAVAGLVKVCVEVVKP